MTEVAARKSRQRVAAPKAGDGPYHDGDAEVAARVLRRFRQVFNAVKTHFQQVEKQVGLGGAQVWALSVIRDAPGIGVGRLAVEMNIHQSTASNLVRTLVEREYVAGAKDSIDRRVVRLKLLAAGARVLRHSPGPFAGVLPDALAALDSETLKRLEGDLGRLIARLQVEEGAGAIPLAHL